MAKTIVGELKELAVKMGADPDDLKSKRTTVGMLDVIEQLVDGGSGGGIMYVNVTATQNEPSSGSTSGTYSNISADKTFTEIWEAFNAGVDVRLKLNKNIYYVKQYSPGGGGPKSVTFGGEMVNAAAAVSNVTVVGYTFTVSEGGTWSGSYRVKAV